MVDVCESGCEVVGGVDDGCVVVVCDYLGVVCGWFCVVVFWFVWCGGCCDVCVDLCDFWFWVEYCGWFCGFVGFWLCWVLCGWWLYVCDVELVFWVVVLGMFVDCGDCCGDVWFFVWFFGVVFVW